MKKKICVMCLCGVTMVLAACTKKVENSQMSIEVNGTNVVGTYTGETNDSKADGEGIFIKGDMSINGLFEEGKLTEADVENINITLNINSQDVEGVYTGKYNNGPSGEGKFQNGDMILDGNFEKGQLVAGDVQNLSMTMKINKQDASGTYTGKFEDGANGKGQFVLSTGQVIDGTFADNSIKEGNVTDYPMACEVTGIQYNGMYTGSIANGEITGSGEFKADGVDYIGEFSEGKLSGSGEFRDSKYVVQNYGYDNLGIYNGPTVDGLAEGEGTFAATSASGNKYTYTGNMIKGLFNGYGQIRYEKKSIVPEIGTFNEGYFTPTVSEWFISEGMSEKASFNVSEKTKKLLDKHESLFLKKQSDSLIKKIRKKAAREFDYYDYKSDKEFYEGKIVPVSGWVFQVIKDSDIFGYTRTKILLEDNNGEVITVTFLKNMNIKEDQYITAYATPLDYSTYESVDNDKVWTVQMAGFCIE